MIGGIYHFFNLEADVGDDIDESIWEIDEDYLGSDRFCIPKWTNPGDTGAFYTCSKYSYDVDLFENALWEKEILLGTQVRSNMVSTSGHYIYFVGYYTSKYYIARFNMSTESTYRTLSGDLADIIQNTVGESITSIGFKGIAVSSSQAKIFVFYDQPNEAVRTRVLVFDTAGTYLDSFGVSTSENSWNDLTGCQDGQGYIYASAGSKIVKISASDYSTFALVTSSHTIDSFAADYYGKIYVLTEGSDEFTIYLNSVIGSGDSVLSQETSGNYDLGDFDDWDLIDYVGKLFIKWTLDT